MQITAAVTYAGCVNILRRFNIHLSRLNVGIIKCDYNILFVI